MWYTTKGAHNKLTNYVLVTTLSVDDPDRAQDAIDNGTLIQFLSNHAEDLVASVVDEDELTELI